MNKKIDMIVSFGCCFGFLVQIASNEHPKYRESSLLLNIFPAKFYRNAKILTSFTAKSKRVREKRVSNWDSKAKKITENYHTHQLCISKKIL